MKERKICLGDKTGEGKVTQSILKPRFLHGKVRTITFVFPDVPHVISGGLKMVLEYANRLTARGYNIQLAFDCHGGIYNKRKYIPVFLKKHLLYPFLIKKHPKWFALDSRVKKILLKDGITDNEIPDADIIVTTAAITAEQVARLSEKKG